MQIVLLLDLAGEKAGWISIAENYLNDVPYRLKNTNQMQTCITKIFTLKKCFKAIQHT
jgi:hypothetical protein